MINLTYASYSGPGGRPYNEDYLRMRSLEGNSLFALADGLGGLGHGELASLTAVESAISRFTWEGVHRDFLADAMETAQGAVRYKQEEYPETHDMSSTLVMLLLTRGQAQWAHIGDSRVYFFRKGKLKARTADHSVPQMLVQLGELAPEEIRHHPDRDKLLRSLGRPWKSEREYEVSEPVVCESGDAFLLCSDGFWEYITEEDMARCLKRTGDAVSWLRKMLQIAEPEEVEPGHDNISAICVRV